MVRFVLEYASTIWDPYLRKDCDQLDVITPKWRRFDVITTLLLRHVFSGKMDKTPLVLSLSQFYQGHFQTRQRHLSSLNLRQIRL